MRGIVTCINAGGDALITLAVAGVGTQAHCSNGATVRVCNLACELPDGPGWPAVGLSEGTASVYRISQCITRELEDIAAYIESAARYGSAAFDSPSSSSWVPVADLVRPGGSRAGRKE